jgi:hypothetical protein
VAAIAGIGDAAIEDVADIWKNSSPQKYWKYGFSTQRIAQSLVGKVVSAFEDR